MATSFCGIETFGPYDWDLFEFSDLADELLSSSKFDFLLISFPL
jgi:hypothetical protein